MKITVRKIVFGALIGAIYAVLGILLKPIVSGEIQVRVPEALTVLPFFSSFSILGLFVGCIVTNIFTGNGLIDIVFGSAATLLAAISTYYIGKTKLRFKKYLAPLPPVIINAVVVGFILYYLYQLPLIASMLWVGLGQTIACYGLGLPLIHVIEKNSKLKSYLE